MRKAAITCAVLLAVAGGQNLRWVRQGPGFAGVARAVVCAPDSNVYVAGTCFDTLFGNAMTVVGLRADGSHRWTYQHPGLIAWPSQPDFVRNPLAYGVDGNLYVAGTAMNTERFYFAVLSLNRLGQERWLYTWAGPADRGGFASAVTRGTDGSIYAGGSCVLSPTHRVFTIVGLTATGQHRWTYCYPRQGESYEMVTQIVCGTDGNIYVAGLVGLDSNPKLTVVSLTSAGNLRWVYQYDSLGTALGYSLGVTCGADGNIYVAGAVEGTSGDGDFAVVSLTPAGAERWVYRYNGPANSDDIGFSVICAADGTVYASGFSIGSDSAYDVAVVSLTPSGSERWVYRLRTHADYHFEYPLALGADGNVYAGGTSYTDSTEADMAIVSLTRTGAKRWVYRYNSPDKGADGLTALAVGPDGNVYAAGMSAFQFAVISLSPELGVEEERPVSSTPLRMPVATIVRGSLNLPAGAGHDRNPLGDFGPCPKPALLDISGRKVMELQPGENDVRRLAPGVYFVRTEGARGQGSEGSSVRRLIVTK